MTPNDTAITHTIPFANNPERQQRYLIINEPLRGNLRLGLFLEDLDIVAEMAALNYIRRFYPNARAVTAAFDKIIMRNVVDTTRDLVFLARLNYVGRTSMEVGIRVEQAGDEPVHIASCYVTMVARDIKAEPPTSLPLQPLEYKTEIERYRYEKAIARRQSYQEAMAKEEDLISLEEHAFLQRLHKEQEQEDFEGLRAGGLVIESWEKAYPYNENVRGTIHGGYLNRISYQQAHMAAELVAPNRPILSTVDRINFHHPVKLGDKLKYTSRVIYTGETTICVETIIERISRDRREKATSNSYYFTFRNVDENLDPQPVPQIYPVTYAEDAKFLYAYRRRQE